MLINDYESITLIFLVLIASVAKVARSAHWPLGSQHASLIRLFEPRIRRWKVVLLPNPTSSCFFTGFWAVAALSLGG
ncbi:hypothetical protein BDY19DRAFT_953766 [Irpex rosettiformis]|uniref:Uncharacterized protein n=1 Tax=Irpex rosettiformis TaxID=378272 RepID=A0ACB8U0Z6_9APHY|nr:hypothetical protein BDY19DRAFT_953766 [Irpex rosettiformis]